MDPAFGDAGGGFPMMASALPDLADPSAFDFGANNDFGLPALPSPLGDADDPSLDPVERLRRLIEEREEETIEILRSWMEEDEEIRS
jgi:flagellar M-ring protein FliF